MLDNRVRARKHQARMTVVETNQVRRLPARPANLDDLARPFRLAHDVATHMEPVSDGCLHPPPPHPRCRATRPPEATLTAWHLATTSIHLDADGSSPRLYSQFVAMLEYKARLYGREFHRIGRFEPTSQVCSGCGVKDGPKPLHIRTW
jgi:hypothetical protein